MKKQESFNQTTVGEGKIDPMLDRAYKSVQKHRDEILRFSKTYKLTKGNRQRKNLLISFEKNYKIPYSEELIKKLRELKSPESAVDPKELIDVNVAEIDGIVADHIITEDGHADKVGVAELKGYGDEAGKIDSHRIELKLQLKDRAEEAAKKLASPGTITWQDATEKKAKKTPGSRAHIDWLRENRMTEILAFAEMQKTLKGKEGSEAYKKFKADYGIPFNIKLLEKLGKAQPVAEIEEQSVVETAPAPETTTEGVVAEKMDSEAGPMKGVASEQPKMDEARKVYVDNIASVEPENESESQEQESYDKDVLKLFNKLGIDSKSLDGLEGFADLNVFVQGIVAKSLVASALEKAKHEAGRVAAANITSNSWAGKKLQGLKNVFGAKKRNREALARESEGGLVKHGAELITLVNLAQRSNFVEMADNAGNLKIDFLADQNIDTRDPKIEKIVNKLNSNAFQMAGLADHELIKEGETVSPLDANYKEKDVIQVISENYKLLKNELMQELMSHKKDDSGTIVQEGLSSQEAAQIIFSIDAKVNQLRYLGANPDLEKNWKEMAKPSGFLRKMVKDDNWKFLATGMGGRAVVPTLFASSFGAAAGFVSIPLFTAGLGAIRGRSRAKKELKNHDKYINKKSSLKDTALFQSRRTALIELQKQQALVVQYREKNQAMSQEELTAYELAENNFNQLNKEFSKLEDNNIKKEALKSNSLVEKIDLALEKTGNDDPRERALAMGALQRRVDFTKDLANRGLVNFGENEARAANILSFYEHLNLAQMKLINQEFDYKMTDLSYERIISKGDKLEVQQIRMQERAEQLIKQIEKDSSKKLDENRKQFIIKKMLSGAGLGAISGAIGAGLGDALSGTHHIAEAFGLSTAGSEAAATSVEEVTQLGAAEIAQSGTETAVQSGAEEIAQSGTETAVQSGAEEIAQSGTEGLVLMDMISNEGLKGSDSVWRSVKEIFKNNAEDLGYTGDASGLSQWAEMQTSRAIANSGEVLDKVFEGNFVRLEDLGDGLTVVVEQGTGRAPGLLAEVIETSSESLSSVGEEIATETQGALQEEMIQELGVEAVKESFTASSVGLEASAVAKDMWLNKVADHLGIAAENLINEGDNIVHTIIGGHDIYISPIENTYSYFNAAGEEVSGFLADGSGNMVSNVPEFFADKLGLVSVSALETASTATTEAALSAALENLSWAESLLESLGKTGSHLLSLDSGSLVVKNMLNGSIDKMDLSEIGLDNIAAINPIKSGYELILNNNAGKVYMDFVETNISGEHIYTASDVFAE